MRPILIAILIIISSMLTACHREQRSLNNHELRNELRNALNDKSLKSNMQLDTGHRKIKNWVLYGDGRSDSITLSDRNYTFMPASKFTASDSAIKYNVIYSQGVAQLSLKYIPGNYMIVGDFYYKYDGNKWVFDKSTTGIVDGKF